MNKKLLTVAIAAALVAPTAVLAEVTVYGQLHMSVDYTNSDSTVAVGNVARKSNLGVSSNSSRIGFKGSEDLGGGMKAVWQIESQVSMDEGQGTGPALDNTTAKGMNTKSSSLGSRNTYLGLAGGFGTALVGKHDTPFKMLGRSLDPFADSIADTRQILGNEGSTASTWDLRPSNVIAYITPNFSGFNAVLAYVSGLTDNTGTPGTVTAGADNNKLHAFSLNATYTNGPIYAGLAYENHGVKDTVGGAGAKNPSAWRLGGSYAFGPAKVGGMWEQLNDTAIVGDVKRSGATLFGTYSFGMETAKLAYTMANKWKASGATLNDTQANLLALGVDHNFSKRTMAYAQYTKLTNKSAADYSLGGGGGYGDAVTPGVGKDPNAFSVGLIHKF
ncbi:Porin_4 domain-containing protein [Gammaproteobacteria bacterium]